MYHTTQAVNDMGNYGCPGGEGKQKSSVILLNISVNIKSTPQNKIY